MVVLVVTYRCIDPSSQPVPAESFGIQFISQVTIHVVHYHEKKEKVEMKGMHRNGEKENSKYTCFHQCFQRMKGISCPGRGIGRMVVHQVKKPEKFFMVHQPVCPVKISIMNEKHQRKCCKKIKPAVITDVAVIQSMRYHVWVFYQQHGYKTKNSNGTNRITDFSYIIPPLRKFCLYFFVTDFTSQ